MAKRLEKTEPVKQEKSIIDIFNENQTLISIVAGLFILIVGGYYVYQNLIHKPKVKASGEALAEAQLKFEQDSFQLALANPGGGNLGILDVIDQYGGTPAGNTANYYAAVSYLNIGKYDAAIAHLEDFSTDDSAMKIMKYGLMGDCYSEKNDLDKAMSMYQKAVGAAKNEELQSYYLLKIGMLNEKQEKFAEAKEAFLRIKQDFPEASFASDIDKYINKVEAKLK